MFMELYYRNYAQNCRGAYWEDKVSLPYAVRVPEPERRAELERILDEDGFRCVVWENTYPVMYVNFTLKRYGRNVKACGSASINRELLTQAQFMENVHSRYKSDPAFRERICDNYFISAAIALASNERIFQENLEHGSADESFVTYTTNRRRRLLKQLCSCCELTEEEKNDGAGGGCAAQRWSSFCHVNTPPCSRSRIVFLYSQYKAIRRKVNGSVYSSSFRQMRQA